MRTKIGFIVLVSLGSIAFAQGPGVHVAKGEGAARTEDGRHGQFRFEAKKAVRPNGTSEVGGSLTFRSETPATPTQPARLVVIELPRVQRFGSTENVAEFGGPGVISIRTRQGVTRHQGKVGVRVEDNRRPTDPNQARPDVFGIKFEVPNTNHTYEFLGKVGRGDIAVQHRRP